MIVEGEEPIGSEIFSDLGFFVGGGGEGEATSGKGANAVAKLNLSF